MKPIEQAYAEAEKQVKDAVFKSMNGDTMGQHEIVKALEAFIQAYSKHGDKQSGSMFDAYICAKIAHRSATRGQ